MNSSKKFIPHSKLAKLKKNIQNFQQPDGEYLYEAWECYKGLLCNYPQHVLNMQQKISTFYNGINVYTRQLLESQGPMTKKDLKTNKALIEEFSNHSRELHNPRDDVTRGKENRDVSLEGLAVVMEKINNMDRRITKMGQSIHMIQVGCENCHMPYLTT